MKIGAQLYSVRNKCETPEELRNTFRALKEMGYESVQVSGFAYDAQTVRDTADEFGLHIGLTHTAIPEIINNTDAVIEKHKIMGADVVGIGYPAGYEKDGIIDIDRMIADLAPAEEKIRAAGLKLAYHNHAIELKDLGGYCALDVIYEKTDWNLTLDTGWVDCAGADAVKAVEKYASRLQYVHLKDFKAPAEGVSAGDRIVPLYQGATPMDAILTALEKIGTVQVAYVEQDNAAATADPCGQMLQSITGLKAHGWVK